ncbi:DUF4127 family protein [Niallia taxi]|uniref:DUF4127 family protein n=1 Tax=Niallia taxi TaxID=2499688 RepID=UPI00203E4ECA|nr:DUF4127 family protein [Niallia taxi]MCM3216748.1 DUF4127 family protein [Niallia taxi]
MTNTFKKNMKKALVTSLTATMVLSGSIALTSSKASAASYQPSQPTVPTPTNPNKTVMLVPLDDRPVNVDMVIKQGAAAGIKVITPPESLIQTTLDDKNDSNTITNGTTGDSQGVVDWIRAHASEADGYIISTDMITSGGLVGSRANTQAISLEQSKANMKIIQELKTTYSSKPVFVFDTVMRLAATSGYQGTTSADYAEIRKFGRVDRKQLSSYSISLIKSSYNQVATSPYGSVPLSGKVTDINGNVANYSVTSEQRDAYINARSRKLDLNYETIKAASYADYTVFGVDDSNPEPNTIQTNEIGWITYHINNTIGKSKATILSDADSIAFTLMARMAKTLYAQPSLKYHVQYFGDDASTYTDAYAYEPNVSTLLSKQIEAAGGTLVTDKSSADVSLLFLSPKSIYRGSMVSTYTANVNASIPTAIVDFYQSSGSDTYSLEAMASNGNISRLIGYSAWNTVGNRIGMTIGNSSSRMYFIKKETDSAKLRNATQSFASLMIDRIIEDYDYKRADTGRKAKLESWVENTLGVTTNHANYNMDMTDAQLASTQAQYLASIRNGQATIESWYAAHGILEKSNGSRSFTTAIVDSVPVLQATDAFLPWNRTFDMTVNTGLATIR